ncbi:hypothetical protein [Rhizobium sp. Leaf371]|uniref:hypothetical protein n=1 Tax=Rhizobium sp. Leaf371 TaxID=1736355 RepID=UPI001FCD473F|nr:hypothetical protein [Rhizobium sp. Leaf371]
MSIQALLQKLQAIKGPDRAIELEIAEILGWRKKVEPFTDPKTGANKERTLWLVPTSNDTANVPFYTSNLFDAYRLAQEVAPGHIGACSWEPGAGGAKIGRSPVCQAATPMIALCMAALSELERTRGQ